MQILFMAPGRKSRESFENLLLPIYLGLGPRFPNVIKSYDVRWTQFIRAIILRVNAAHCSQFAVTISQPLSSSLSPPPYLQFSDKSCWQLTSLCTRCARDGPFADTLFSVSELRALVNLRHDLNYRGWIYFRKEGVMCNKNCFVCGIRCQII